MQPVVKLSYGQVVVQNNGPIDRQLDEGGPDTTRGGVEFGPTLICDVGSWRVSLSVLFTRIDSIFFEVCAPILVNGLRAPINSYDPECGQRQKQLTCKF